MGLDFSKKTAAPAVKEETAIETVKPYDIAADRQQMNAELVNSEEVDRLVSTIEIDNAETIVNFGAEVAEKISKASDVVLNSMSMSQLDDSSELLKTLAKIMDQFDINEIKENPGFFGKLFGNMKKQLDRILEKYHTMGDEVDKIYVQLKGYEAEIRQSNRKLNLMFEADVNYYHELVKYILAGEQGCREIEAYIAKRQMDMEQTGDSSIQFELTNLTQMLNDVRTAHTGSADCGKCCHAVHSHVKDHGIQQLQPGPKNQFRIYCHPSCFQTGSGTGSSSETPEDSGRSSFRAG